MEPVATALISWLAGQALSSGQERLVRLLRGDRQRSALRKIVRASTAAAVAEVVRPADRQLVEDALLREGPGSYAPEADDVASLSGLVARLVDTRLAVLAAQGHDVDAGRLSAVLAARIAAGIQADAVHHGTLGPLAEWLRHQEAMVELRAVSHGFRRLLSQPGLASLPVGTAAESVVAAVHTLPADNASFTGRAGELSRVPELLAAPAASESAARIVTIDGMAGVGKTTFAVHAAHKIAAGFPDGQFFIRLHGHTPGQQPTEPGAALAALLGNLGIPARQIPPGTEARAGLWRDRMAGKRALLVLDDATGTGQVVPLLPGSAGSLVLVTSRRRLAALPQALAMTLDVLAPADAARLLARLAGKDGLAPSADGIEEVVRLCGHLPLAISLTAGHLKHHPAWTVSDLVDHLTSATNRIAAIRAEDVSVAAAFDLSYRDLTGSQQRLFRRLGLLPGPDIDAYAAAALDGASLATVRTLLDDLYIAHLVDEPARGRYRLHDLIREHAVALADADDGGERAAAMGRLLDYYAHSARLADTYLARRSHASTVMVPDPPAHAPDLSTRGLAIAWMQAERANLHAAARHAAAGGRPRHATAIAIFTHGFLRTQGHWDQALDLHGTALAAARAAGDRLGEAETLNNLGVIQRLTQDYPAAADTLTKALEIYRELGNRLGEANALNYLGVIGRLTRDYASAKDCFAQALAIFSDLGDLLGQGNALNYLGVLQQATGELRAAASSQEQALARYRSLGDRLGEANALFDLGVVQQLMDDYPAASAALNQALGLYQESGNRLGRANALKYLGSVQKLSGDCPAAIATLNQALSLYREVGSRRGQADTLEYLSLAHERSGHAQAAADALTLAQELRRLSDHAEGDGQAGSSGQVRRSVPPADRARHEL